MPPKDDDGIANSVYPGQTALKGAVCSGYALLKSSLHWLPSNVCQNNLNCYCMQTFMLHVFSIPICHTYLQEKEEIVIPKTKDSFDVIQCDSPVQLVEYILSRETDRGMPLDKVSKVICWSLLHKVNVSL